MRSAMLLTLCAVIGDVDAFDANNHADDVDGRCRDAGIGFSNDVYQKRFIACARATTVGGTLSVSFQRGCVLARTSTGIVTATLDPTPSPVGSTDAATDSLLWAQSLTGNVTVQPVDTSGTVKTFNFFTGGGTTAAEAAFEIEIYQLISR